MESEFIIENESLVCYTLKNPISDKYIQVIDECAEEVWLKECSVFEKLSKAKQIRELFPQFTDIRKIKVIDIGRVIE